MYNQFGFISFLVTRTVAVQLLMSFFVFQGTMSAPAVKPVLPAPSAGGQAPTPSATSPLKNHASTPSVTMSIVNDKTPDKPKESGEPLFVAILIFIFIVIWICKLNCAHLFCFSSNNQNYP